MPELPEVETIRRALQPCLLGKKLIEVLCHVTSLRKPLSQENFTCLLNARFSAINRYGKYIIVEFENLDKAMLMHLGMSGACRINTRETPITKHERMTFFLDNGMAWRFDDTRKFGTIEVHPLPQPSKLPPCLSLLAPDPLDKNFSFKKFNTLIKTTNRPIKNVLLDQQVISGIGNIYAAEALFFAGINPTKPAAELSEKQLKILIEKAREVLEKSILAGGSTIRTYAGLNGSEGNFAQSLQVYGRDGKPCQKCGKIIQKSTQSGRSTFHCPGCQN